MRLRHSRHALTCLAVLTAGAAGQQAEAVTPQNGRPPSYYAGWLEEIIGGNLAGAVAIYEKAARDPRVTNDQRALARIRLIQIHTVRNDAQGLDRLLATLPEDLQSSVREQMIERLPDAVRELRAAVVERDDQKASELRPRAEELLQQSRGFFWWRSPDDLGVLAEAGVTSAGSTTEHDPDAELRLLVPLLPSAWIDPERQRAAQIADLRLRERRIEADRLESDFVDRLRLAGRHEVLAPAHQVDVPPADAIRRLAAARRRIVRAIDSSRASARDVATLTLTLERIDELAAAGKQSAAVRLLATLPYAGLLEDDG